MLERYFSKINEDFKYLIESVEEVVDSLKQEAGAAVQQENFEVVPKIGQRIKKYKTF